MSALISVRDLSVTFYTGLRKPRVHALRGLDLEVQAGEIVSVLGPNGSGKTTLLRVLAGVQRPSKGYASVLERHPTDRWLVRQVGFQPDEALPFPTLTGLEFLLYLGSLMGLLRTEGKARALHWLQRLSLGDAGSRLVGQYSTGMQRRLAVAAAMLAGPEVLLLDEPTSGLDPEGSLLVMELLREHRQRGGTTLMASHHLQEVEQISSRVVVLSEGRKVAAGTLAELLATGDQRLVVRDLDAAGLAAVEEAVGKAGGEVVEKGRDRQHLFALFRRLQQQAKP
ncbi:MAG: ABC transporter ATP-binding protein [Planctomycetota bacterium]|jgi:ABC-type multidrug transport system ATPase subunit